MRAQGRAVLDNVYYDAIGAGAAPQRVPSVFMAPARPGAARLGTLEDRTAALEGARLLWRVWTLSVDGPPLRSAGVAEGMRAARSSGALPSACACKRMLSLALLEAARLRDGPLSS